LSAVVVVGRRREVSGKITDGDRRGLATTPR
jgi:hypothetical protein